MLFIVLKGEGCQLPKTARRLAQKQPSFKKCVTAYLSRQLVPKMDGAKSATDTVDILWNCGREASCLGKSTSERRCELCRNENPGGSRIIAV